MLLVVVLGSSLFDALSLITLIDLLYLDPVPGDTNMNLYLSTDRFRVTSYGLNFYGVSKLCMYNNDIVITNVIMLLLQN